MPGAVPGGVADPAVDLAGQSASSGSFRPNPATDAAARTRSADLGSFAASSRVSLIDPHADRTELLHLGVVDDPVLDRLGPGPGDVVVLQVVGELGEEAVEGDAQLVVRVVADAAAKRSTSL